MERRPLIAGNWKMYTTVAEAEQLAAAVARAAAGQADRDVMIAPPYTALSAVSKVLSGSVVKLGAQNVHWEESGAFTGEISPAMLREVGCVMAIIGHSERRHVFGETDFLINRRITGALLHGIIPVFCIGETLKQRESEQTMKVLEDQVKAGLAGVELHDGSQLVVAYEPVWAIGTGKTATEEQAQEVHAFIRTLLEGMFEKNIAGQIRILYGGSVKPENIDILMSQPDIDGALVGGAALKAESFERIICFQ
jgi:triosephosphate isomerase (TIM)